MRYLLVFAFAASLAAQEKIVESIEVRVTNVDVVDTNMKPGDEVSLILWARRMEMITPLTNDKAAVMKGIESILSRSRAGSTAAQEDERVRQECRQFMQEVDEYDPPVPNQRTSFTWENAWISCEGGINAFADSQWQNSRAIAGALT